MMAADLMHDLKNLIQAMTTCARLIEMNGSLTDEATRKYAGILVENGSAASRCLQTALEGEKTEYYTLRPVRAELSGLVSRAARAFLPEARRRDVELRVEPGVQIECELDVDKITRAAMNLISNAIRYARSLVDVSARVEDGQALIEVWDDGAGFTGDPFQTAYRGEHNGIGLQETRHFAALHGGRADAAREGERTVFRIYMPLENGDAGR